MTSGLMSMLSSVPFHNPSFLEVQGKKKREGKKKGGEGGIYALTCENAIPKATPAMIPIFVSIKLVTKS